MVEYRNRPHFSGGQTLTMNITEKVSHQVCLWPCLYCFANTDKAAETLQHINDTTGVTGNHSLYEKFYRSLDEVLWVDISMWNVWRKWGEVNGASPYLAPGVLFKTLDQVSGFVSLTKLQHLQLPHQLPPEYTEDSLKADNRLEGWMHWIRICGWLSAVELISYSLFWYISNNNVSSY